MRHSGVLRTTAACHCIRKCILYYNLFFYFVVMQTLHRRSIQGTWVDAWPTIFTYKQNVRIFDESDHGWVEGFLGSPMEVRNRTFYLLFCTHDASGVNKWNVLFFEIKSIGCDVEDEYWGSVEARTKTQMNNVFLYSDCSLQLRKREKLFPIPPTNIYK